MAVACESGGRRPVPLHFRLWSADFHLTQNGNLHFTLYFQGCGDFLVSKNGEPPQGQGYGYLTIKKSPGFQTSSRTPVAETETSHFQPRGTSTVPAANAACAAAEISAAEIS